jgi:transcriptional regulator with GAF, ATPase, and Fis domain
MQHVRELIAQVAPTEARVLILGESGTGKELVANAIHRMGMRASGPFVSVNCAAIPRDLVESEMFGHERGAFTGATDRRTGRFELADGGTLFLDEVGDLQLEAQAKLLRVLESGEIQRIGAERSKRVDIRVLAATNRRLEDAVASGQFREDLYFRLNVFPIIIPPLRDRMGDLPALVQHLAARLRPRNPPRFTPEAIAALARHTWPGNVRELANIVERLTIIGGEEVTADLVPRVVSRLPQAGNGSAGTGDPGSATDLRSLTDRLDDYERDQIAGALNAAGSNIAEAARLLPQARHSRGSGVMRRSFAGPALGAALWLLLLHPLPIVAQDTSGVSIDFGPPTPREQSAPTIPDSILDLALSPWPRSMIPPRCAATVAP